ncbi:hypothetical protein BsWGS_01499 [Bradybaena similaris]
MEGYMCGLGEGFLDFCGANGYSMESSYSYPGEPQLYGDFLDFQDEAYLDSPESDQENCVGFFDSAFQDLVDGVPKKHQQRKAANMRERRRMKSINDAFEHLRRRIPCNVSADRRLSKVDTLRQAIRYISYLTELVKTCGDHKDSAKHRKSQEKIILRCHMSDLDDDEYTSGQTLIGHSLSWSHRTSEVNGKCTLSAKIWMPETPSDTDLLNLAITGGFCIEGS